MLFILFVMKFYYLNKMILVLFLKWFFFNIGCNFYIIGLLYVENVDDKKIIEYVL